MDFVVPEGLQFILEIAAEVFLGVVFGLASIYFAWQQRLLARRTAARELYEALYSPEAYTRRVAPVVKIMLKWRAFKDEMGPGEAGTRFREALRAGWLGLRSHPDRMLAAYAGNGMENADQIEAHFRTERSVECVTEHEALTTFLNYWVVVYQLLKGGVVDKDLTRELLRGPFHIYKDFLAEFRDDLADHHSQDDDGDMPAWVGATEELDRFFA